MLLELTHWAFKNLLWIKSHHGTPDIFPSNIFSVIRPARSCLRVVFSLVCFFDFCIFAYAQCQTAYLGSCYLWLPGRCVVVKQISAETRHLLPQFAGATPGGKKCNSLWLSLRLDKQVLQSPLSPPSTLIHLKGLGVFWVLISYALAADTMEKGSATPAAVEVPQMMPPPYTGPEHPVGVYQTQPQAHIHYGKNLYQHLSICAIKPCISSALLLVIG